MELVNNDSRLLLVATSHRNITSISNTLVFLHSPDLLYHVIANCWHFLINLTFQITPQIEIWLANLPDRNQAP